MCIPFMNDYCDRAFDHPLHRQCHDESYGFPVSDDRVLYGRLLFEIFQAGLNWLLILQKAEALQRAFADFDYDTVAQWGDTEHAQLMMNKDIIRNRRKIQAAMDNARSVVALRTQWGSFKNWLDAHHPQDLDDWVVLFRQNFVMTGRIVVHEFLMSTGYLKGAHRDDCPIHKKILALNPPWLQAETSSLVTPAQKR